MLCDLTTTRCGTHAPDPTTNQCRLRQVWSDSDDEAGNESDDGIGALPQNHTDVRRLRIEERRRRAAREEPDHPSQQPQFVPNLPIDRTTDKPHEVVGRPARARAPPSF